MAKTSEGKVKDAVKARLEHYGVLPFIKAADAVGREVVGMYWMPGQGAYAVQGVHDIVGCWSGVFFSLETKSEDNLVDATGPQEAFKVASLRCGGISFVGVRSVEAVDQLAQLIRDRTEQ